jgi:hypothetical protein
MGSVEGLIPSAVTQVPPVAVPPKIVAPTTVAPVIVTVLAIVPENIVHTAPVGWIACAPYNISCYG